MPITAIETVIEYADCYLVNSVAYVPKAPGNIEYELVQSWIALGNTPSSPE